jgi:UDP-2-acetamido-2,6-beta-L-arabino-hexul-4-ose reductase
MRVTVERIEPKSDPRGCVWEPASPAELTVQQNCHVVVSEPGAIRGNHFHKLGTEIATQRGPALVRFRDQTGVQDVIVAEGEVVRFVFPPNCAHAFQNTGTTANLLVAFNTVPHEPAAPDVYREALIS